MPHASLHLVATGAAAATRQHLIRCRVQLAGTGQERTVKLLDHECQILIEDGMRKLLFGMAFFAELRHKFCWSLGFRQF